jgi:hypothetical protein
MDRAALSALRRACCSAPCAALPVRVPWRGRGRCGADGGSRHREGQVVLRSTPKTASVFPWVFPSRLEVRSEPPTTSASTHARRGPPHRAG